MHRTLAVACWGLAIVLAGGAVAADEAETPDSTVSSEDASGAPSVTQPQPPAVAPEKHPAETPRREARVSRVLIVVGPLAAVAALMGLYWLILRHGAM